MEPPSVETAMGPLLKVTKRREPSPEIATPESRVWDESPAAATGREAQLLPPLVETRTAEPRKSGAARTLPSEEEDRLSIEPSEKSESEGAKEAPPSVEV